MSTTTHSDRFKELTERIGERVRDHFEEYEIEKGSVTKQFSLFLILLLGFIVRLFPTLQGWDPLIKAFDPWFQLRSASYILENGLIGYFKWHDYYTWFPYGRAVGVSMYIAVPLAAILIYLILQFLGFNVTLAFAAYLVPVVFGTITVYLSYLLGKELISDRGGLIVALTMAVTPSYVQRSIAGFFDNESVGVLFTIMSFYFFIRALRRNSAGSAILAGLSLFMLGSSWGAFRFGYDLLGIYALVLVMTGHYSERLVKVYTITIFVSTYLMILIPRIGGKFLLSTEGIGPIGIIVFLIFFGIVQNLSANLPPKVFKQILLLAFVFLLTIIGLAAAGLAYIGALETIGDKFISVILPDSRSKLPLIDSVSEHQPLTWASLYFNINTMVFFIPIGLYFAINKPTERNLFTLTWGLITIYFSGSMIRLLLILAPAAALLTALAVDNLLIPYALLSHKRIKVTKATMRLKRMGNTYTFMAYAAVFGLLAIMVSAGITAAADRYSRPEITPSLDGKPSGALDDWMQAFQWMRDHTSYKKYLKETGLDRLPPVMLSWWDYGYYITSLGETITLVDGSTINSTQIGVVGTMLMWNETAAINLMYKYNVQYVLVFSAAGVLSLSSDIGKAIWMIRISEKYTPEFGVKEKDYFKPTDGYLQKFYDSVLYRLMAYAPADMTGVDQSPPPFIDRQGLKGNLLKDLDAHPVTSLTYFKEVFRSSGYPPGGAGAIAHGDYPLIRIYKVIYPEDMTLRMNEFDQTMAQIRASQDESN